MPSLRSLLPLTTLALLTAAQTGPSDGEIYRIEYFPAGCGNGDPSSTFVGREEYLATCTSQYGFEAENDDAAVRFSFFDDSRTFKWRLFMGGEDVQTCQTEIAEGEGGKCVAVPKGQNVGSIIVYT